MKSNIKGLKSRSEIGKLVETDKEWDLKRMLAVFIAPHQNCRYQASLAQLSRAELHLTLSALGIDTEISEKVYASHTAFMIDCDENNAQLNELLSRLSGLYMVCRAGDDGALYPLFGRKKALLGDDMSGILKYKGKTSEMFTRLLMNVARLSSAYALQKEPLDVLDPICGKGTTLMEAINAGNNALGMDVDAKSIDECKAFMKRYLTYHKLKHSLSQNSLTANGKSYPMWQFTTAADIESYKSGDVRTFGAITCDALIADKVMPRRRFNIIAGDLPYGVQHAPHAGNTKTISTPEQFTAQAIPVWAKLLAPGGALALSFNSYTLKRQTLRDQMRESGLKVMEGGPYDSMEHWVEQAVMRDVVVAVKS